MLWDNGKLGLGQRSRTTHEESRGKAYVVGTAGSWDSGVQIWDGQCCERTLDELPTDGLRNAKVYVEYMYSTELVLSAELC